MCLVDLGSVVNLSRKDLYRMVSVELLQLIILYILWDQEISLIFVALCILITFVQKTHESTTLYFVYLFDHGVKAVRDPPNIYLSQWEGIVHSSASWPSGAHLVWFGAQLLQTLGKKPSSFAEAILIGCFLMTIRKPENSCAQQVFEQLRILVAKIGR